MGVFENWGFKLSKVMQIEVTSANNNKSFGHGYVVPQHVLDRITGRVLTLVEGMGLKDGQERAIKDLIKQEIWAPFNQLGTSEATILLSSALHTILWDFKHEYHAAQVRELNKLEGASAVQSKVAETYTLTYKAE